MPRRAADRTHRGRLPRRHSPPLASQSASAVPSPPSATGSSTASRPPARSPSASAVGRAAAREDAFEASRARERAHGASGEGLASSSTGARLVGHVPELRERDALAREEERGRHRPDRHLDHLQHERVRKPDRVRRRRTGRAAARPRPGAGRCCRARAGRSSRRSSAAARAPRRAARVDVEGAHRDVQPRAADQPARTLAAGSRRGPATATRSTASPCRAISEQVPQRPRTVERVGWCRRAVTNATVTNITTQDRRPSPRLVMAQARGPSPSIATYRISNSAAGRDRRAGVAEDRADERPVQEPSAAGEGVAAAPQRVRAPRSAPAGPRSRAFRRRNAEKTWVKRVLADSAPGRSSASRQASAAVPR